MENLQKKKKNKKSWTLENVTKCSKLKKNDTRIWKKVFMESMISKKWYGWDLLSNKMDCQKKISAGFHRENLLISTYPEKYTNDFDQSLLIFYY